MKLIYKSQEFEVPQNTSIKDALKEQIENSAYPVLGAKFNNEYKRLDYTPQEDGTVELVDISTKGGMNIYRRTLIFIMAKAFDKVNKKIKIRVN